ncbi:MAG: DUF167 domain-containing protein [Fibrobacter sp.]|nr:DUF167 domain-containing protein [Fibrobacter sp.]
MRINIKVITRSSQRKVVGPLEDGSYRVYVSVPPVDGAANKAVCELLAKHFNTAKSSVTVHRGHKSNQKIIDIED